MNAARTRVELMAHALIWEIHMNVIVQVATQAINAVTIDFGYRVPSCVTHINFCGRVPWLYQYWPGGFMLFVVLCPGTPEGSTGSGSGFKASQKTGQRLKVSSDRLGEAGNRTCDPWFTRHRFIPYTTAASCDTYWARKCYILFKYGESIYFKCIYFIILSLNMSQKSIKKRDEPARKIWILIAYA